MDIDEYDEKWSPKKKKNMLISVHKDHSNMMAQVDRESQNLSQVHSPRRNKNTLLNSIVVKNSSVFLNPAGASTSLVIQMGEDGSFNE